MAPSAFMKKDAVSICFSQKADPNRRAAMAAVSDPRFKQRCPKRCYQHPAQDHNISVSQSQFKMQGRLGVSEKLTGSLRASSAAPPTDSHI